MAAGNVPEYRFLVGGEWRENPAPIEVRFPYTGDTIARVHQATVRDLEDAAGIAEEAFECTRRLSSGERSRILSSIADQVESRASELARVIVLESGKTVTSAAVEVQRAVATLRTSAEEAKRIGGEVIPLDWTEGAEGRIGISRRFPCGPVLGITPFNFPLNLACHKLGPAIAAGNPFILKPASATPVSSILLAEMALCAGLAPEALSVVPCPGELAERLVSDSRIAVLTFTGSPEVGWSLKERAGRKKVTLELGGNAAVIVHSDADADYAATRIVAGGFSNAGQVCISVQRVLLHEDIHDYVLSRICAGTAVLRTGDPRDQGTDVGPMISASAVDRAGRMVDEAVAGGAQVVIGGTRNGPLFFPTVLCGTHPAMRVEQEEVFAPVITVNRYSNFDDALASAGRSRYGLQLGVFSRDFGRIMKVFAESRVGGVVANDIPTFRVDHMPYGGVKGSGTGREGPRYAIQEMTDERLLVLDARGDR
ncbi:MAG TPA: aldehyde dehydrogenase family protein [Methanoregulaceae archaeon]|nr:MAG: aldehyde dehydrogenase family protein [Methanolinea sp.]HON81441.1 aldehyde dehydrogenase family protein [Methanoregulaceae archaeon]HPD10031.1 aldehyde dehydrogenase family protein [Methanoregulaceae archaeon]HRT15037.1 aldehyde dehydrogenase family protein [Methanoregulaceae archaeon]HRU30608.1 aldehyde dehydrogenase family protein [Methanoregulaceae archaeon]